MDVLLVDDHALIREGIALVMKQLGDDTQILEAETAEGALEIAQSNSNLDLVLLDLNLPDNDDFSLIQQALQIGANGFIPKSSSSKVMLQAVQLILAGGLYLPPQLMNNNGISATPQHEPMQNDIDDTPTNNTDLQFTKRQTEVLRLLDQGLANKEIARKLDMSPSTVKVHVAAILRICEASNRTQAVSLARQLGVIS